MTSWSMSESPASALSALPAPSPDALISLMGEMERELGTRVCVVGGYVRDLLMGRTAAADVDVVLERVPAETGANWLRDRWGRRGKVVSFERYGTSQISLPLPGGQRFTVEFVRARSESYSRSSRKPQVRPGTMEEDSVRRDFTINTLLLSAQRAVLDPTGRGIADIRSGLLRTPLDPLLTFDEDPLRMFRAARFASQLDFDLAPGMEEAMRTAAPRIRIVSSERIRDELLKLLLGDVPSRGLHLLLRTGLLARVVPELARLSGVAQGGFHLGDVFEHTAMAVERSLPDRLVRLGVLFHDVGKPDTFQPTPDGPTFHRHPQRGAEITVQVMRRLRFPGAEVEQVARLVELHMRPIQYRSEWADSAVRRLWHDAGELAPALLEVARADTKASSYPGTQELDELKGRMDAISVQNPGGLRPPLDGNRLKKRFGLVDGPWIGRAQQLLTDALVDGRLGQSERGDPSDEALLLLEADRSAWEPRPGEPGPPQEGSAEPG